MAAFTSALITESELITGLLLVTEAPNFPLKTTDFVIGNDVIGAKVSTDVSGRPVDSHETRVGVRAP